MIKFDVLNRFSGRVQFTAEIDSSEDAPRSIKVGLAVRWARKNNADLRDADLRDADLRGADLRGVSLRGVDLRDVSLRDADLRGADLRGADLRGVSLRGVRGLVPERVTPLLILLDQVGKIRAYKLVTKNGYGPFNGGLKYEVGKTVSVKNAVTDVDKQCAAGISLATLDWILASYKPGQRIFLCEFTRKDIAAIPTATDGKFRVHRCKVVKELNAANFG